MVLIRRWGETHNGDMSGASAMGGTMYGMSKKTTVYLSDELKAALEREAKRTGESEAEVIRRAIKTAVSRPRPRAGIISSGELMADRVDELLEGFGEH